MIEEVEIQPVQSTSHMLGTMSPVSQAFHYPLDSRHNLKLNADESENFVVLVTDPLM